MKRQLKLQITIFLAINILNIGKIYAEIVVSAPLVNGPIIQGTPSQICTDMGKHRNVPCADWTLFALETDFIIEQAYNAGLFDKMDNIFHQWCQGADRFPDGTWKLSRYSDTFDKLLNAWDSWENDLKKLKDWQNKYPDSFAAKYLESVYWQSYAWKARGRGYASSVSPEAWALFKDRLDKSNKILEQLRPRATECPVWYSTKINNMVFLGDAEREINKVYEEGISIFPEYHKIYFAAAIKYTPKWGGNIELYDSFAKKATQKTQNFEGNGMYARLYWIVDYNGGIPFDQDSQYPDFNLLKSGFEDLSKKYPVSLHNMNQYASVACRSTDHNLYNTIREKIDGFIEEELFNVMSIDACDLKHHFRKR